MVVHASLGGQSSAYRVRTGATVNVQNCVGVKNPSRNSKEMEYRHAAQDVGIDGTNGLNFGMDDSRGYDVHCAYVEL